MLKKTTFAALTIGQILILWADILYCGCPSGMIQSGDLCYKWHDTSVILFDGRDTCSRNGGKLAGAAKKNFLETLLESPLLLDYLLRDYCYWAFLPASATRAFGYSWFKSVLPEKFMPMYRRFAGWYFDSQLCFNGITWTAINAKPGTINYVVCEYDASLFKEVTSRPRQKLMVARRKMDSAAVADTPLFVKQAAITTMCSRHCQGRIRCLVFTFNKVTGECRGFQKNVMHIHYHQDWEVWVFEQ